MSTRLKCTIGKKYVTFIVDTTRNQIKDKYKDRYVDIRARENLSHKVAEVIAWSLRETIKSYVTRDIHK